MLAISSALSAGAFCAEAAAGSMTPNNPRPSHALLFIEPSLVQPKLTCSRKHRSRLLVCSNSRTIVLPQAASYRRRKKPAACKLCGLGERCARGSILSVRNATCVSMVWVTTTAARAEAAETVTAEHSRQWQYRSVARTDRGLVRPRNEDSVVNRPQVGIWAVADGMGGHNRGDRASHILQEELTRLEPEPPQSQVGEEAVRDGISAAHDRVRSELGGTGMSGTTVVALAIRGDRYTCLWAGDSRLYRSAHGALELLTTDHSVVQELVDAGAITPEAAVRHPLRNRITRAVGVEPTLELQESHGDVRTGERFLLCSDGLHGFVDARAMGRLAAIEDLDAAADALVAAALDAGGRDNISLVLVAAESRPRGGVPQQP